MVAETSSEIIHQQNPVCGNLDNSLLLGAPPPDPNSLIAISGNVVVDNKVIDNYTAVTQNVENAPYERDLGDYTHDTDNNGNSNQIADNFVQSGEDNSDTSSGKSDTASTYSDPFDNSYYTDSVGSANSKTFLIPPKDKDSCEMSMDANCGRTDDVSANVESSVIQSIMEHFPEISAKNFVVEVTHHFNKDCTDKGVACSSSLIKSNSMWSCNKDSPYHSTAMIGMLDHPGYIASSQGDLGSTRQLSFACQKAVMYLKDEKVASSLLLPGSAKDLSNNDEDWEDPSVRDHSIIPSAKHTKNLIALGISLMMLFIATGSVRNLQSSINHEGGVGMMSLAVSCAGYVIGSIFSPFLVQKFQPRKCLIVCLFPHLLYVACNIYPTMWLMVPVSAVYGICAAILWNAMSTYVTFLAKGYSEKRKTDFEHTLSRFFGIFCLIWQTYMIVGNLIASLVLMYANKPASRGPLGGINGTNSTSENTSIKTHNHSEISYVLDTAQSVLSNYSSFSRMNSSIPSSFNISSSSSSPSHLSLCGAEYCHHFTIEGSGMAVTDMTKYLLFGIYMGCILISLLIAVFILESLNNRLFCSSVMTCSVVNSQLKSLGKFMINKQFILLVPLLLFSSVENGFATAEVTKAFITCPLGIHMVGYTMICMGLCASGSAYLSGWLNKFVGRTSLICTAAICNLGLLAVMAVWRPTPDVLYPYFLLLGIWGITDGIWISQTNSLMGVLFPCQFEEAYAGLRIMQGLGTTISFSYAQSFCMATKIYITAGCCIVGMMGYFLSEYLLKKKTVVAKTVSYEIDV